MATIIKKEKTIRAIKIFLLVSKDERKLFLGFPNGCLPEPRGFIGTPERIPVLLLQFVIGSSSGFHHLVSLKQSKS